ncbi:MAG: hypothetical protein IPJ65_10465 [Archangiaceae bacterium]|nr:hypothetical protein [Archangiaceae bacterium]
MRRVLAVTLGLLQVSACLEASGSDRPLGQLQQALGPARGPEYQLLTDGTGISTAFNAAGGGTNAPAGYLATTLAAGRVAGIRLELRGRIVDAGTLDLGACP